MAEIEQLPPVYRIPATQPGSGAGPSSQAPQRKSETGSRRHNDQRQRRKRDDDDAHIDEYA